MWDEKSIYPSIETGYAYTKRMNDELIEKFNSGNFLQGSAILKIRYYIPKNLTVHHIPVKERGKKSKLIEREMVILYKLYHLLIYKKLLNLQDG